MLNIKYWPVLENQPLSQKLPLVFKSKLTDAIVLFYHKTAGVVIEKGQGDDEVGFLYLNWVSCTDKTSWQPVNVRLETKPNSGWPKILQLQHKDIVCLSLYNSFAVVLHPKNLIGGKLIIESPREGTNIWKPVSVEINQSTGIVVLED
jgi:hypothetical protein